VAKESLRDLCQRLDAAERDRVAERDRATAAEVEAKKAKESQAAVLVQLQVGESVCRRTHPPPCQPTVNHLDRSLCATAADLYPNVVTRRRWVLSRVALLCFFPLVLQVLMADLSRTNQTVASDARRLTLPVPLPLSYIPAPASAVAACLAGSQPSPRVPSAAAAAAASGLAGVRSPGPVPVLAHTSSVKSPASREAST
jgi:hypothetical protein